MNSAPRFFTLRRPPFLPQIKFSWRRGSLSGLHFRRFITHLTGLRGRDSSATPPPLPPFHSHSLPLPPTKLRKNVSYLGERPHYSRGRPASGGPPRPPPPLPHSPPRVSFEKLRRRISKYTKLSHKLTGRSRGRERGGAFGGGRVGRGGVWGSDKRREEC